ncbi:MAG: hypothetical protein EPN26_11265 [Rhodospirillales bacterium]|nr:MAG: hypothetical protein EPN26_11265 [Rhodospirillales bacterium]
MSGFDSLEEVRKWFPTGTAEGERDVLKKAFIHVNEFQRIISPPQGCPHLLIGKKGSGKSAIIDFAIQIFSKKNIPALLVKPQDLDTSQLANADSLGEISRKSSGIIISAIASKMAGNLSGLLSGDDSIIYNQAVNSGEKSPDIIGKFTRIISKLSKPLIDADLSTVLPELSKSTRNELQAAIHNKLSRDAKFFYLFIDDTDQVASPNLPGHLNRIWGLIIAVRSLSEQLPELRAIISLRTEVWERLRTDEAGQRDQTDHFTNLCIRLNVSNSHIKEIIARRLELAASKIGCDSNNKFDCFFEGTHARAPYSEENRYWSDLIVVRSRQRPRDAVQLINALATRAISQSHKKINESDFQYVMPTFSNDRVKLISQEVDKECPAAEAIIRSFASCTYSFGGFSMSAEEAKEHIAKIPTMFGVVIYGKTIQPTNNDSTFQLWKFLYQTGILNARISDSSQPDNYRHIDPEADPTLVSLPRWNEMQKMVWEIHPAYRDFLVNLQKENQARTGLALKRPPTKKKR